MSVPYIWIAGEADSLALWPVGDYPVSSAAAAEHVATTAGYDLDREIETVEHAGRWCVFVTPHSALRVIGETLYGPNYVTPLARLAGVEPRTMRRWLNGDVEPRDWLDIFRRMRSGARSAAANLCERAKRAREILG